MNIIEFIEFINTKEYFRLNLIDEDLNVNSDAFLSNTIDGIYNEVDFEECFFTYLNEVKDIINTHCDDIVAEICFEEITSYIEEIGEALESVYYLAKDNIDLLNDESKKALCW